MKKLLLTLMGVSTMMTALFAQAPADLEVCVGKGYTLTSVKPAAGEEPITYQWYENSSPIGSGTPALAITEGRAVANNYTYVRVASNAACTLSSNAYTVRVGQPGAAGEPRDPTCGCVTGTSPCGSTCKTNGYTYTYDGNCAGCSLRYVKQWNQCGALVTDTYTPQTDASCWSSGCPPVRGGNCNLTGNCVVGTCNSDQGCDMLVREWCDGYKYYNWSRETGYCKWCCSN
jgi:hypothetical protein